MHRLYIVYPPSPMFPTHTPINNQHLDPSIDPVPLLALSSATNT